MRVILSLAFACGLACAASGQNVLMQLAGSVPGVSAPVLKETFGGTGGGGSSNVTGAANDWQATMIVPGSSYTCRRLEFRLQYNVAITGTITAYVWADDGVADQPSTLLATSTTTFDASTLTTSYAWAAFDFAGISLTSGTKYHVGFSIGTNPSPNQLQWELGSSFNNTNFETSRDDDGTAPWTQVNGGRQGYCRTYE